MNETDESQGNESSTVQYSRKEIYQNPDYVTLYRFENTNVPYDGQNEGATSKQEIVGAWFCDSLQALRIYTIQRINGVRGGNFVTVRVRNDDLAQYDAESLSKKKIWTEKLVTTLFQPR